MEYGRQEVDQGLVGSAIHGRRHQPDPQFGSVKPRHFRARRARLDPDGNGHAVSGGANWIQ